MYLIVADNGQAAREHAKKLGQEQERYEDPTFTWKGLPARFRFLSVRKLITISNPNNVQSQDDEPPVDGTELSYSLWEVSSLNDAEQFARGEAVNATAVE